MRLPCLPVGGPIPLNRYRAFRKTAVQARGERIEALATKLGLPRAALESRPDVAALVQPEVMPVQAFVDPDPFRQLTYVAPGSQTRDRPVSRAATGDLASRPVAGDQRHRRRNAEQAGRACSGACLRDTALGGTARC